MNKLDAVIRSIQGVAGPRPHFLEHADCDRLLAMILALAGQLSTVYERVDTLTRVLEENGLIETGAVEGHQPSAEAQRERLEWDEAFVRRLLRVLAYELETLKDDPEQPLEPIRGE